MPNYIILSTISTFVFAALVLVQKYGIINTSKNPFVLAFYVGVFSIIFAPIIWVFIPFVFPSTVFGYLVICAFLFFLGNTLLYWAFSLLDASVAGSLFPLRMIFVPFLAVLFLNESYSASIYMWIAIATMGAVIASYNETLKLKSFFTRGTLVMFFSMFLFTVSDIYASKTISVIGPWSFQAWFILGLGIFSFLLIPIIKKDIAIKKKDLWNIPVISVLLFIGVVLIYLSFKQNITIPNAITTLGRIPIILGATAVLSKIKPKLLEHHPTKVYIIRTIGTILIIAAVLQIILAV